MLKESACTMSIDAVHFEGVKISMNQSSDGIILKLAVHPDDCPPDLMTDWVGSRYMVAMVRLDDEDKPIATKTADIDRLIASCGALCRNPKFQEYVLSGTGIDRNEENTVRVLRDSLGITSRSDLRTNEQARSAFRDMREDFNSWLKR